MAGKKLNSESFAELVQLLNTIANQMDAIRESVDKPLTTLRSFEGNDDGAFTGGDAQGMYDSLKEISEINDATYGQIAAMKKIVETMADKLGIALSFIAKDTSEVAADLNKVATDTKN